jgi:diguanylate cyclase (GGDEF)-like protein
LATTDALTQVANRRHFDQMLAQEWAVAQRDQTPLALIICDVDYFKAYNDHYGHPAGDRCLQQIAQIMKGSVQRPGDVLARYGGEEFVILLPRTTTAGAIAVVTKIQACLAEAALPHRGAPVAGHITLSFGLAGGVPRRGQPCDGLLATADTALYRSKLAGRNQYHVAETSDELP